MKKIFCAASVFPSLLIASGVVFASSDGAIQLSDVNDTLQQIIQEQKDLQVGFSEFDQFVFREL